jgi:hypothetical protein
MAITHSEVACWAQWAELEMEMEAEKDPKPDGA